MSSSDLEFHHIVVGPMDNNCWLIGIHRQALLIDAADEAAQLLDLATEHGLRITDVLTTHQHADHVGALREILSATEARHHAPRLDAKGIPAPADFTYGTDAGQWESLDLAGERLLSLGLTVVELRGHTPGGLAVYHDASKQAWVGDSVFPGGVGKTETAEDFNQLLSDVNERIFTLPEATTLHPGHGDSTTVAEEKPKVEQWRQRGW